MRHLLRFPARQTLHLQLTASALAIALIALTLSAGCGKKGTEAPAKAAEAAVAAALEVAKAAEPAAAAEPAKVVDEAPLPGEALPKLVPAAADVDFAAIKAETEKYKGKTVRCKSLLAPMPMQVRDFGEGGPASLIGIELADRWTSVFCRTHGEGLDSVPVQIYFAKGEKGNLLHIGRESVLNVEIRGTFANQVVARFRGLSDSPTDSAFANADAPDLLSVLLWPERYTDKVFDCTSKMAVTPQEVAGYDKAAVDAIGVEVAPRKAVVHCDDMRGVTVSALIFFATGGERAVLEIGSGTVVRFKQRGFFNNQLVGLFEKVVSGAVKSEAGIGDMKRILIDPKPAIGKSLTCETLVAPQPAPIRAVEQEEVALIKDKIEDMKTSLMCRQASGGSVGASVYFPAGKLDELLKIGSETKVKLQVWGVRSNRIVTLFQAVESGGIGATEPGDMRAVALRPGRFQGKAVDCQVVLKPYVGEVAYLGDDKQALFGKMKLAKRHSVVTCKDASSNIDGTRIELYFDATQEKDIDNIGRNDVLKVKILGAAYGTLVAAWQRTTKASAPAK